MAATPSILIRKHGGYKGGTKEWSNRYHFSGGTPADSAHWTTLANAIVTAEKAALSTNTTIDEAIGYAAGSDVPVWSGTYATAGTVATGAYANAPLEVAALVRYSTDVRTAKNHPVYLFNYYHRVLLDESVTTETLASTMASALGTYAADWISGFSDGANTYHRAGPNGAVALGAYVHPYVTHRDFPRS